MLYVKMQTGNSEEGYCSRLEKIRKASWRRGWVSWAWQARRTHQNTTHSQGLEGLRDHLS